MITVRLMNMIYVNYDINNNTFLMYVCKSIHDIYMKCVYIAVNLIIKQNILEVFLEIKS